jgi:myosin heavy subunit
MTAAECYKDLRHTGQNQAILVTGESGSGKTEASKHIMTFITFVCVDHIELLNSLKQKAFVAADQEARKHHHKSSNSLRGVQEGNEGDDEAFPFDMSELEEELTVQEQVDQTFESHTTMPQRSTMRRSRVVAGGPLFKPPPPPPRPDTREIMFDSCAAVNGSCGDLSTLRDAAQNEADLREIFDGICDDNEMLSVLQLKSFGQIEEAVESNVVSEDFIDLLVVKFNDQADEDEKDKINFTQFKQVLKLIEEEISRKEMKKMSTIERVSGRPVFSTQYSGAFDYTEASLDNMSDDDSFNDEGNVVNPLQLRSMHDIRSQLLESITILEAFGNSQTVRNDNSSRFAKYVELQFDEKLVRLVGGKISTFLLERSRLVHQIPNEYNFHILSYLTRGSNAKNKIKFLLESPDQYKYLMYDAHHRESMENPAFTLDLVRSAMITAGFSEDNMDDVFCLLSGILSLGNLEFEDSNDEGHDVVVGNQRTLDVCAQLFQVKPSALNDALVSHKLYQGTKPSINAPPTDIRQRRITCAVKMHDVNYATISRDSLAKELYTRLFHYIVSKLNEKIDCTGFSGKSIGILDICGFEIFAVNRFEQFCINWANEKLHLFFIEQTLRAEMREYESEGINLSYAETILDNEQVVSTIEGKEGLVALLDDQILLNDYNPDNFITNVNCLFVGNSHMVVPNVYKDAEKKANTKVYTFGINHYAGTVTYNAHQFIEKNADTLYDDLMKVMRTSKSSFVVELCAPTKCDNEKTHNKKPPTVGSQFRKHLNGLVKLLEPCNPRYVCCIKPNESKSPEFVDSALIKQQIEYLGMTKHIAIRQEGYCFRSTFDDFIRRYRILSTSTWPKWDHDDDQVKLCQDILTQSCNTTFNGFILRGRRLKPDVDYAFGRTKVFIKDYKAINSLEKMRTQAMTTVVARVQAVFRMRVDKREYFKTKISVLKIQTIMRKLVAKSSVANRRRRIVYLQQCIRNWIIRTTYKKMNTMFYGKYPKDHVRMLQAKTRGLLCRRHLEKEEPEKFAKCMRLKNRICDLKILGELKAVEGVVMLRCKLDAAIHSMALTQFYIVGKHLHWNVGVIGKNKVGIPLEPSSKVSNSVSWLLKYLFFIYCCCLLF